MIVLIPKKVLSKVNLTAEEYFLIMLIDSKDYSYLDQYCDKNPSLYKALLTELENKGYIYNQEGIYVAKDLKDLKNENYEVNLTKIARKGVDLDKFIDSFREIFPKGQINGYPCRGDKQGCKKKMNLFLKKYPEYGEDMILKATENYVRSKRAEGYTYMQAAHYFIEKNGSSTLAAFCEELSKGGNNSPVTNSIDL